MYASHSSPCIIPSGNTKRPCQYCLPSHSRFAFSKTFRGRWGPWVEQWRTNDRTTPLHHALLDQRTLLFWEVFRVWKKWFDIRRNLFADLELQCQCVHSKRRTWPLQCLLRLSWQRKPLNTAAEQPAATSSTFVFMPTTTAHKLGKHGSWHKNKAGHSSRYLYTWKNRCWIDNFPLMLWSYNCAPEDFQAFYQLWVPEPHQAPSKYDNNMSWKL